MRLITPTMTTARTTSAGDPLNKEAVDWRRLHHIACEEELPCLAAQSDPRGGAIDAMNRAAASDPRLEALILPVRDGSDGILVGVVREQRHA